MWIEDSLIGKAKTACTSKAIRSVPTNREVRFLPGTWAKNTTRKLTSLVWPSEYLLLVIFHAGGNEVATHNLRMVKEDIKALEWL